MNEYRGSPDISNVQGIGIRKGLTSRREVKQTLSSSIDHPFFPVMYFDPRAYLSRQAIAASLFASAGAGLIVYSISSRGLIRHHQTVGSHVRDNCGLYCGVIMVTSSLAAFFLF